MTGLRDVMNRNRAVTIGAACAMVVVAIVVVTMQARDGNAAATLGTNSRSFYSIDDGKTWFKDDASLIPPFTHEGKEAVRAYVYRGPDGKEFVGFLERYSPQGKRAVEAALKIPPEQMFDDPYQAGGPDALQVKRPGAKVWISVSDPRAQMVYQVAPPNNQGAATPVTAD